MKSTQIFSSPFLGGLPPWLAHPVGVLLVMLLVLSSSALGAEEGDFVYERAGVGARVTGYRGSAGAVVIPERLGGLPVISIGDYAFNNQTSLTSVTIPTSVTSIGDRAFSGCYGLTSVVIPSSVTSIGAGAFSGCVSLTSVVIPSSVTTIGGAAFSYCRGLTSVTIPSSVTSIGGWQTFTLGAGEWFSGGAFYGCSGLTSVTLQQGLTTIGVGMFSGCSGLTSVTIPNGVTNIGAGAFEYCGGLTNVTIPNSVTTIGFKAFSGCTGLTSVTIPNRVTSIEWDAFSGCTGLTSVTIPNSVTSIRERAFYGCTGLTGLYFQGRSPALEYPDSMFPGANQATVYYLPGSTGWGGTFGGRPTALWLPQMRNVAANFGVQENQFGFDVSWAPGQTVVVEDAADLAAPVWSPVQTLTLTGDSIHFSDPEWTNYPTRLYRLRTP